MKKTRFKEEQMVKILREADQAPVAEVAKRHGVSVATIYGWRQRFGKLEVIDVKHFGGLGLLLSQVKTGGLPCPSSSGAFLDRAAVLVPHMRLSLMSAID